MIDLHVPTNFSDGSRTPEYIIDKAAELGLKAVAVTDHDTVAGIGRAVDAAAGKAEKSTEQTQN